MGRPQRIQFPGACYFVTLQGNNRQDIFLSNQDRRHFLALLKSYKDRSELKVYSYCLMNNHAQLLVETVRGDLSRAMQGFNTVYTKYFNRQHNTVGHVFQGRYKAMLVDKDKLLLEMTCYVHLTPVREGLKVKPWRYLWSSCAAYVESGAREPLVDSEAVLRLFAKNRLKQSVKYLQFIKERMASTHALLPVHGSVIGSPEFAASAGRSAPPPSTEPSPAERAKKIVSEFLAQGLDEEKLFGRSQWREISSVRKKAVYRLWKEARLGVTEIGRMFHRTPSAISQLIRSVETAAAGKP